MNDCLYTGPIPAEHIFDELLRFWANRVDLTGDAEKAFLMVGMAEEDRAVLRFLWVDEIEMPQSRITLRSTRRQILNLRKDLFA